MTEQEWLACHDPEPMLGGSKGRKASKRKRRLFGCACCRRIWHLIPDERSRVAVLVAERFVDGFADNTELETARAEAHRAYEEFKRSGPPYERHYATGACSCVAMKNAGDAVSAWYGADAWYGAASAESGCASPEILAHCREPGPHVRGCWVVDAVLGKE